MGEYVDIRKITSERPNKHAIEEGKRHQERVRFHALVSLHAPRTEAMRDFTSFVRNVLNEEKSKLFFSLMRWPIPTNDLVGACFDRLSKIFNSGNSNITYNFSDKTASDDWEWYRKEHLCEPLVWSGKGWDYFRTAPNSFLVVDLPVEQSTELPEPYFYWLSINDVIAFDTVSGDNLSWIAFYQDGKKKIAYIDAYTYNVYNCRDDGTPDRLESERPHDLGYCPVAFFSKEEIDVSIPVVKGSPITESLEKLDWFLFFLISKRNLDLFGSYPIYSGYEQECDYRDADGHECHHGYLVDGSGNYLYDANGTLLQCPLCSKRKIVGAGSYVEVPAPGDGIPDMRNPIGVLAADTGSLSYNVEEEKRLKDDIISSICGSDAKDYSESVNELQVKSSYESRNTVLSRVKRTFEEAQAFVDGTVCRLRYGNLFVGLTIDYGDEFVQLGVDDLRVKYKEADEAGASQSELSELRKRIAETEFNNSPDTVSRIRTLSDIEPYPNLTVGQVVEMQQKGLISREDARVKVAFADYISRFERENIDVVEFGSLTDYANKIRNIKEVIYGYAREDLQAIGE